FGSIHIAHMFHWITPPIRVFLLKANYQQGISEAEVFLRARCRSDRKWRPNWDCAWPSQTKDDAAYAVGGRAERWIPRFSRPNFRWAHLPIAIRGRASGRAQSRRAAVLHPKAAPDDDPAALPIQLPSGSRWPAPRPPFCRNHESNTESSYFPAC